MARRTKEDAEATRNKLLDAALEVFYEKGVTGASLTDVAVAASVTRGAIYWHFKDKMDLLGALIQRTSLPFEKVFDEVQQDVGRKNGALRQLAKVLQMVFHKVVNDAVTRRVFDITLYKVEYAGEMQAVRAWRTENMERFALRLQVFLEQAAQESGIQLRPSSRRAARGLRAVFDGVLLSWLLHEQQPFDLEDEGMTAVKTFMQGLGFEVEKEFARISSNC